MNRILTTTIATAAAAGLALTGAATASAQPATGQTHARVSHTDRAFLKSNEQVNLAEITLAKIVLKRSHGPRSRELARVTMHDHRAAMAANEKVARAEHVTLPTQPSRMQRTTAADLSRARRVSYTYFKDQIAGHIVSIEQTKHEIADGHNAAIKRYARYYLPVAQKHLRMSRQDLRHYRATH